MTTAHCGLILIELDALTRALGDLCVETGFPSSLQGPNPRQVTQRGVDASWQACMDLIKSDTQLQLFHAQTLYLGFVALDLRIPAQQLVVSIDERAAELPLSTGDSGERLLQLGYPFGLKTQLSEFPQAMLDLPQTVACHRYGLDDELVRTRIRIALKFVTQLRGHRRRIERHL